MGRQYRNPPSASPAVRQGPTSLEQLYAFRRTQEVADFLEAHPFLIPLLLDAYPEIEKHFGQHPQVFLEVITDPEATDDQELFAFIATNWPPSKALQQLDHLDEEWWLAEMGRAQGVLCIHVEYL